MIEHNLKNARSSCGRFAVLMGRCGARAGLESFRADTTRGEGMTAMRADAFALSIGEHFAQKLV